MWKISLDTIDARAPRHLSPEKVIAETEALHHQIIQLQNSFYAWKKKSILVILQWMDASWKDDVVQQVFSGMNIDGLSISTWKHIETLPLEESLDTLYGKVIKHGLITVLNRSYYEALLLPSVVWSINSNALKKSSQDIIDFEKKFTQEGNIILKCYLHISKDTQLIRLAERLRAQEKILKHTPSDLESRRNWDVYMKVYETVFESTDTFFAPWSIIPSDDHWYKVYQMTKLLFHFLNSLPMKRPTLLSPVSLLAPHKDKNPPTDKVKKEPKWASVKSEKKQAEKAAKKLAKEKAKAEKKATKAAKKLAAKKEKEAKKLAKAVRKAAHKNANAAKKLAAKREKKMPAKKPVAKAPAKPTPQKAPVKKTPTKKSLSKSPVKSVVATAAKVPAPVATIASQKVPSKPAPKALAKSSPAKNQL